MEEKIQFPFQYLIQYLLGEITLEKCHDDVVEELCKLMDDYIKKNKKC